MIANEVAARYFEAANAHDAAEMAALWIPGGQERIPAFDLTLTAPDGLREHFEGLFRDIPDVSFQVRDAVSSGEIVAVLSVMTGTHLGPYQGLHPTGKAFSVDIVDWMLIERDRIRSNLVLTDGLTIARQLGVLPDHRSRLDRLARSAFNASTRLRSTIRTAAQRTRHPRTPPP